MFEKSGALTARQAAGETRLDQIEVDVSKLHQSIRQHGEVLNNAGKKWLGKLSGF
jgi:hypothetical protein